MGDTVADRLNGILLQLPADASVGDAMASLPEGGWLAISGSDDTVAALVTVTDLRAHDRSESLAVVARSRPPMVAVPADLPVAEAVRFPACRRLQPHQGILVERDGIPIGVWAGQELAEAIVAYGSTRLTSGVELQGRIEIAVLRRMCGHQENGADCAAVASFPEPPDTMPQCPNPRQLTDHTFVW